MRHPVLDALRREKKIASDELDAHMLRLVPIGTRVGVMLREGQQIESIATVVNAFDGMYVVRLARSGRTVDVSIEALHVRRSVS